MHCRLDVVVVLALRHVIHFDSRCREGAGVCSDV
jgi:hypothetical protein